MTDHPANFCWYELMTSDPDAAASFYSHVVGWSAADAGHEHMRYTIFSADRPVGGVMAFPGGGCEGEPKPGWIGNIEVADVDVAAARLEQAGGQVHCAPSDIPTVGRFAMVSDPQGAAFVLFKPLPERRHPAPAPMTLGHVGWHELHAKDGQAAFDFYSAQFGWTKADALDMGPMGTYQIFSAGALPVGAMMTSPDFPRPAWLFYFVVDAIEPAIERIRSGGGRILNGPMEVPGGAFIVQAEDPQGAMFALVAGPSQ